MGTDCVLLGATCDDQAATNPESAFRFTTDGSLLTTFTKPASGQNVRRTEIFPRAWRAVELRSLASAIFPFEF